MALFKRKEKDTKKGGENTIGKIIYGFLLFMPLLSIGARCLYVIFNKNAYQSYSETMATTTVVLNSNNIGVYYVDKQVVTVYKDTEKTFTNMSGIYGATNFTFDANVLANTVGVNYVGFQFYTSSSTFWYLIDDLGNPHQISKNDMPTIWSYQVDLTTYTRNTIYNYYDTSVLVTTTSHLDNVFEYSIDQTQESNIYNWAKQTGTYTVLQNTTTGLGITNEFIPMLMAYWLIISVIYFLFDIALILIWAVHKKIHELSEAI